MRAGLVPFLTFREMRNARGMEIADVAFKLGVPSNVLIDYEDDSGKIPISIAMELCRIYKVPSIDCIIIESGCGQPV